MIHVGFLLFYGADTDEGSSGGPVTRIIGQKHYVVAVHCGTDHLNYGMLLSDIIYHAKNDEIKAGNFSDSIFNVMVYACIEKQYNKEEWQCNDNRYMYIILENKW